MSDTDRAADDVFESIKRTVKSGLEGISNQTDNFRSRPGQRKLIAETAKTLYGVHGDRRTLVAEAPTGTGKGIGYLLGAIPVAMAEEKTLIISTATVALQEQLMNYDLPIIKEKAGIDFEYALAKGRGRYVCNRNLANLTGSDSRQGELDVGEQSSAAWDHPPSDWERKTVFEMEDALSDDSNPWQGDLDQWREEIPAAFRSLVTTDHNGCLNRNCPFYSQCAYVKARHKLNDADVVVANHSLVLKDLQLGGGKVITPPDKSFYVFDEGHHLNSKTLDTISADSSLRGGEQIADSVRKVCKEISGLLRTAGENPPKGEENVRDIARDVAERLADSERIIEAITPESSNEDFVVTENDKGHKRWRLHQGVMPEDLREEAEKASIAISKLKEAVVDQKTALEKAIRAGKVQAQGTVKVFQSAGFLMNKLQTMEEAWDGFSRDERQIKSAPSARWIDWVEGTARERSSYMISYSSTSAAGFLRRTLFANAAGVVITSATLTSLGNFKRIQENLGLEDDGETRYLVLPSPFDYQQNAELLVPDIAVDPKKGKVHTDAVIQYVNHHVSPKEGALVLFASRWQMEEVAKALPKQKRDRVLIQGRLPKAEIIAEHSRRLDLGEGSMIFGLASFAEGIDLPGRLCVHVVIAKLPFTVPDSPVEATYAEYLEATGRNPFMEVSVPDVGVKLTQACGRLIRSESDHGKIALLDRRISTKPYGRMLIKSLPPYRVSIQNETRVGA